MRSEWWEAYGGRIVGIASGLLFGLVYLFAGFWDMLFFALLVGIGYWFGKQKDEKRPPLVQWDKVSDWVTDRWPWSR